MDVWSTFALVLKRRYLAGAMLLLTLGASVVAVGRLAPVFEVKSDLVLLLPAAKSPDGNPYTTGFENQVLGQLVAENMRSPAAVRRMSALGADPNYEVSAEDGYTVAFLHVIVRNRAVPVATRTAAILSEGVQREVQSLQRTSGAPEETWIHAVPLTAASEPHVLGGSRIRPLAGLALASLFVTLGILLLAEGMSRRRARRRAGGLATDVAPPWLDFVDQGVDIGPERAGTASRRFPLDAVDAITIFLVLLFVLPARLVFEPLGAAGTPANIWGLVLLLWWATDRLIPSHRSRVVTFQPVRLGILFLALAALVSYSAAFFRPIDATEIFAADRGLISLAAWFGVALVAADGITTLGRLRRLIERISTAGAGLAILGILQFFTALDVGTWLTRIPFLSVNGDLQLVLLNDRSGFNRVGGTTNHPIEFSAVLAMMLPLALHLAFHADASRKLWAWIRAALIGLAVPLSISRTGMLGVLVGGVILFSAWPAQRRWRAVILSPFCAVGLRLLIPGLLGSIGGLFLRIQSDDSFTGRTDDYAIAGRLFSRAPFFGRGWGTLLPDQYLLLDNQLLKTLLEGGLVSLLALLAFFALGIGTARGARHRGGDAEARELGQTFVAAIAVGAVTFATFDAFAFVTVPATLFLVVGCSGALWRLTLAGPSRSHGLQLPGRLPVRDSTPVRV